jgi:hypothetical protein
MGLFVYRPQVLLTTAQNIAPSASLLDAARDLICDCLAKQRQGLRLTAARFHEFKLLWCQGLRRAALNFFGVTKPDSFLSTLVRYPH